MEYVLAITGTLLVLIQFHRNTLLKKQLEQLKAITVNVPAPIVNVVVEAPESVPLQAIESTTIDYDYTYLEAILQQLVDLHKNQQTIPFVPNYPIPVPQYPVVPQPPFYPMINGNGDSKNDNKIEIDGVTGKQFPPR